MPLVACRMAGLDAFPMAGLVACRMAGDWLHANRQLAGLVPDGAIPARNKDPQNSECRRVVYESGAYEACKQTRYSLDFRLYAPHRDQTRYSLDFRLYAPPRDSHQALT